MNGLTLRISGGGSKKTKNTLCFATVTVPESNSIILATKHKEVQLFLQASSVDQQLTNLKNILNSKDILLDKELIKFLIMVFLQPEIKHPVKCFLTRSITKSDNLQQPFATALSEEILTRMTDPDTSYRCYIDVVARVASCVENFPAGAAAVKTIEIPLAEYLNSGLNCIVRTLSETKCLSPTEKNELFNLAHSMLRLILYIAQKVSPDRADKLNSILRGVRSCLKSLLFDGEVPMDTKSVCGIVYVTMYMLQNNPDSWINILNDRNKDETVQTFLENDASRLCLYSAIATVVPSSKLRARAVDGTPAVVLLTANVIAIGERTCSDWTFNLAVTRTLLQVSKGLAGAADEVVGLRLVDALLAYVWAHLDHYMDSVRHLTAQILANVVRYCARLQEGGDRSALDELFSSLRTLDPRRKSYYVSLTALTASLGTACVMDRMPHVVRDAMDRLHVQAVQASATTALETLLHKQTNVPSNVTYERWILPIVARAARPLESPELAVLEGLLTKVVKQDESVMDYILPHIKKERDHRGNLKCILMLLSVGRKSGVIDRGAVNTGPWWTDIVGCHVLQEAAVSSLEQTRILSLSLVVESPKSTEVFAGAELELVLYFLKYNANTQAPNFRQLMLSLIKKFLKRFEDSYKALKRQKRTGGDACDTGDYYLEFLEKLRAQCFADLVRGANYGRRYVALQTLAWSEQTDLQGYRRHWREDYVEKLLLHLEDSYESNKALSLEILQQCPVHLLQNKTYSTSLDVTDILAQASSVKPTDCVSAAYKLSLLQDKLPRNILGGDEGSELQVVELVSHALLRRLLAALRTQLAVCHASVVAAARAAPMYGLLHCMMRVVDTLPAEIISKDEAWSALIAEIVTTCIEVNGSVACVVNNSSPEGHLPMDMGGVEVTDHGNSGNVRLADGRPVTAQMVLLCAWRSVKEVTVNSCSGHTAQAHSQLRSVMGLNVSLLLGSMCSRLEIGSQPPGSLTHGQVLLIGDHFTTLLAETKHRGAFEQAYVGFGNLLARLWRCRSPELHELPKKWLEELMVAIQSPRGQGKLCATRRSAGLPFMIQALVTTELQVRDNPTCFHACMATLLTLARAGDIATRTHCTNVLRALVRHSALRDAVAPHVGAALGVALAGFDGTTWEERNSSTLLFSALMVRVFGVQRSRDGELCVRNRMTGRVFFLRYPELYDLLLSKLENASRSPEGLALRPALYPVLLLLARLYPSALEGTVSNLKLVAFVPHVVSCARSADMRTRRLAAAAAPPLISPQLYVTHLDAMLHQLRDESIARNHCHGVLLQITRLLDNRPDELSAGGLRGGVGGTLWVLRQPCYVIVDEYLRMVNLLLYKFPTLLERDTTDRIVDSLSFLLFNSNGPVNTAGRATCLANAAYLYFIILNVYGGGDICRTVCRFLSHECYEVVLSALNYILILHKEIEIEDRFQEHLSYVSRKDMLETLNTVTYLELLCDIVRTNEYLECNQKALRVLTLSGDTQCYIIRAKEDGNVELADDVVLERLIYYIENEHENLTYIYLQSLSNFVTTMLANANVDGGKIVDATRVMFACSSSDNGDATRRVVFDFLDANIEVLLALNLKDLQEEEKFEYKATLYCTLVTMLEDDEATLSQSISDLISKATGAAGDVLPSRCAESLRDHMAAGGRADAVALLTTVALLDFKCEVVTTDEGNDECRVFDQNERYNVNLEETVWARACAEKIVSICGGNDRNLLQRVRDVTGQPTYRPTLDKLCGDNFTVFRCVHRDVNGMSSGTKQKVQLFIDHLSNI